jgi:hypothetical protein
MWYIFNGLSTSLYSTSSKHPGLACYCTVMNHFEYHLLLCFRLLLMLLLPASEDIVTEFPSRHPSSSCSYPLDWSGLGDPTGSNIPLA